MEHDLTPAFVQQALATLADLHVDEAEAAALIPLILANRRDLACLDRFDVAEVRPAVLYDPTVPPAPGVGGVHGD
jgi:hypothetical protein